MARSLIAVLVGLLCIAARAPAQGKPSGGRLTLAAGAVLVAERDEHASPLRYDGAGPFVRVSFETRTEQRALVVRLGGAIGTLRSAMTGADDLPRQELTRGWIDVEYARRIVARGHRTRWLLGASLAERGTVLRHLTVPAGANIVGYALYSTAIGPLVAIEATGRRSRLGAQLAVPVLALIGRPYGGLYNELTLIPGGLRFHLATIDAFQAVDVTTAYAMELTRGAELLLSYQLVVERYRDDAPLSFASQAASLGLTIRLGADR